MGDVGIVVGRWSALPKLAALSLGTVHLQSCAADVRQLKEAFARHHHPWLLVGDGVAERTIQELWYSARLMRPAARLAMLGKRDDLQRCHRWLRRGCSVYLRSPSRRAELQEALRAACALNAIVIGRGFIHGSPGQPLVMLTEREEIVLRLLADGMRNAEIAEAISVSENTVEFHVSRLLSKLGARNRVEAAGRAINMGLV